MRTKDPPTRAIPCGHGHRNSFIAGCVLALASAGTGAAQQPTVGPSTQPADAPALQRPSSVRGLVRDSADTPIPFATVVWGEARQVITTSDSGAFALTDIPPGKTRFTVRRLGYAPVDFDLMLKPGTLKPVVVHLVPAAPALSTVEVEAHAPLGDDPYRDDRFLATGFFDRKAHLAGYFISPDEVERRRPTYVSDLLYGVPGVMLVGRAHTPSAHYMAVSGHCRLQVYLDGHAVPDGDDFVSGSDIKAVEVYSSLLRASDRFLPSPQKGYCGSIVVWTK
jgi:hypothetical protein